MKQRVMMTLLNYCYSYNVFPDSRNESCIIPVPINKAVQCMNDLRPVALTSVVMKVCKKIVLNNSKPHVEKHLDPCQVAYQEGRWAEDAIVSKLDCIYTHLHTSGRFVKMLYYDLSSAFNTNSTTYHG